MSAPIKVTLPDGSVREVPAGTTPRAVAEAIGPGLARAAATGVAKLSGQKLGAETVFRTGLELCLALRAHNPALSANPWVEALQVRCIDGLTARNTQYLKNTSLALFGQLSWKITDRLTIQPGARINYDKKDGYYQRLVFAGDGSPSRSTSAAATSSASASSVESEPSGARYDAVM